jgi:hypothetical protein
VEPGWERCAQRGGLPVHFRPPGLSPADVDDVIGRHPIAAGNVDADAQPALADATRAVPAPRTLAAAPARRHAQLRQAKRVYRIEATEYEPEDLSYVRQALLVAGEIAAMTDGIIVDLIAFTTLAAEDDRRSTARSTRCVT